MNKEKVLAIQNNLVALYKISLLVGIVAVAPLFFSQPITGSFVNMALFLAAISYGIKKESIFIAMTPSIVAFLQGSLPFVLAPMVPFIVTGNIILITLFIFLNSKTKNYLLSVVGASFVKFLFLFLSSQILLHFVLKNEIAAKFAIMMSWPQFITALAGGTMAFIFMRIIKNKA